MANGAALVQATSAGIGRDGSTYVLLRWEAVDDVTGYNLYPRVDGTPARESRPINGSSPIRPPSSARQLRAVVPGIAGMGRPGCWVRRSLRQRSRARQPSRAI